MLIRSQEQEVKTTLGTMYIWLRVGGKSSIKMCKSATPWDFSGSSSLRNSKITSKVNSKLLHLALLILRRKQKDWWASLDF